MPLASIRRLLPAIALAAAVAGCSAPPTEPVVVLDCSTLARNLGTTTNLITTSSGLRYRDVVVGTGDVVTTGRQVVTRYAACLQSGDVFSQVLSPMRFTFPVGTGVVFPGLDEGVQGMQLGGRRHLVIPANLGFGTNGSVGGFPVPNETFVMTIDAVGLK